MARQTQDPPIRDGSSCGQPSWADDRRMRRRRVDHASHRGSDNAAKADAAICKVRIMYMVIPGRDHRPKADDREPGIQQSLSPALDSGFASASLWRPGMTKSMFAAI